MFEKYFFVQVPNKMFAYDTNFFATNDELIVFYNLGTVVQARNPKQVLITIDMLNSLFPLDLTNYPRGKKRIMKALKGLQEKGYIKTKYDLTSIKNSSVIEVFLPDSKDDIYTSKVKSGAWTYYGYTEVTDDMYEKIETVGQFKILIYVKFRAGIADYRISYREWELVLDVSHQTAVKLITECHKKDIIKRLRGDYYTTDAGEVRQEPNRYDVKVVEEKKINLEKEINTTVKSMGSEDKTKETRKSNWFKTGQASKLNADDMYIYLTTSCYVLKKHAEKRINGLNSNENGNKLVEALMKKAKKRIRNEKQKEKPMSDLNILELEFAARPSNYKYKKQHNPNDISHILGDD